MAKLMTTRNYRERDGVSLLIGLGLVTVLVLFGLIVSNVVVTSIRQSANVNRANEAYFATEGALEQGLMENRKQGAGYTGPQTDINYNGDVGATYQVEGQVPEGITYGGVSGYFGMYGVPTPGTGNTSPDCDPLQAVTDSDFMFPGGSSPHDEPTEHWCNWNKIKVGQTATIPLFYTDANGDPINLFNQNSELILRVRTACPQGKVFCLTSERPDLNYTTAGDPNLGFNDPIVTWQITAEDANNNDQSIVLGPYIDYDPPPVESIRLVSTIATELKLFAAKMNGSQLFEILTEASDGVDLQDCQGTIKAFLTNGACTGNGSWSAHDIQKPLLKISVISSLVDTVGNSVPHLEWQLLSSFDTGTVPTDVSQTITAEGFSGEFKQILEVKQPQEGGLLEYVIQQ